MGGPSTSGSVGFRVPSSVTHQPIEGQPRIVGTDGDPGLPDFDLARTNRRRRTWFRHQTPQMAPSIEPSAINMGADSRAGISFFSPRFQRVYPRGDSTQLASIPLPIRARRDSARCALNPRCRRRRTLTTLPHFSVSLGDESRRCALRRHHDARRRAGGSTTRAFIDRRRQGSLDVLARAELPKSRPAPIFSAARKVAERKAFRQHSPMSWGACVDDSVDDCNSYRPTKVTHEVEQPAGVGNLDLGEVPQGKMSRRQNAEHACNASHHLRPEHFVIVGCDRLRATEPQSDAEK